MSRETEGGSFPWICPDPDTFTVPHPLARADKPPHHVSPSSVNFMLFFGKQNFPETIFYIVVVNIFVSVLKQIINPLSSAKFTKNFACGARFHLLDITVGSSVSQNRVCSAQGGWLPGGKRAEGENFLGF